MIKYIYTAGEYHDCLYELRMVLEELRNKLEKNKRLVKDDRLNLIEALNIIEALELDK
jgi:hypothetical protein